MTNWFDVTLVVAGPTEVVDALAEELLSVPAGPAMNERSWREWTRGLSGAPAADGRLRVDFENVWGPPHALVDDLAWRYPALHITYIWDDTGGFDIAGRRTFHEHLLLSDDTLMIKWKGMRPTAESSGALRAWMDEIAWPVEALPVHQVGAQSGQVDL